jgi:CBS domain-containing protein
MSKIRTNIIDAEWSDSLSRLRDARALVLRDAESFHQAAMSLERIGQVLSGKVRHGLGAYESELLELALADERPESNGVARLFETVREARNMAVHEGAWARHLSTRLVELLLILEQAIIAKMKCAEDIMVQQPVVAETWHLISHVRQAMLANSFSNLPVLVNNRWHIVTDLMVMRFLRGAANREDRNHRLSTPLGTAIEDRTIAPSEAKCFSRETKLADLDAAMDQGLVLITDGNSSALRLVGILSPFDLL